MSRMAFALVVAVLAAPLASAQGSDPAYPDELLALLPGWLEDAEALATAEDRAQPWWGETSSFLAKARAAAEAGRFRVALFHLETYGELLMTERLLDEARTRGSDAEGRTYILQTTRGWRLDAERAWIDYREQLHGYDGQLRSVVTIEKALYASDIAIVAAATTREFDHYATEFPRQSGLPDGYVLALVRSSHGALLGIERAQEMLAQAVTGEGLPPRILEERWANLTQATLQAAGDTTPGHGQHLDALAAPARENGEATISVAFSLAEQRAARASSMHTIFGDAATRGLAVVRDAAAGMGKQLNNTTLETPRGHGLSGVFTSDAIDRARFTNEFVANETASLGTVIAAWSALEHQRFATTMLGAVSPVAPAPPKEETPAIGLALLLAMAALAALGWRRR